mgnify:CR=1 FL=1
MGLNDAERIWMNLKDILIINILSHRNKRYAPIATRISINISAR